MLMLAFSLFMAAYSTCPLPAVAATELETIVDTVYEIDTNGTARITLDESLRNIAPQALIATRIYRLPSALTGSIEVRDSGGASIPVQPRVEGQYSVIHVPLPSPLQPGERSRLKVSYSQMEMAVKHGRMWEVWAPGLRSEAGRDRVIVNVPKTFGPPLFINPPPNSMSETADKRVFVYEGKTQSNQTIWMELGDSQAISVKASFALPESRPMEEYVKVVLPRDFTDGSQQAVLNKITPEPVKTELDREGNCIAFFDSTGLAADSIDYEATVILRPGRYDARQDLTQKIRLADYLQPLKYWESTEPEIVEQAKRLSQGATGDEEIGRRLYDGVIELLQYDDDKLENNNMRIGALQALRSGRGVCMEYADLFIALCRSAGIPARAVFGFAYNPQDKRSFDTGHQWAQIFLTGKGWVNVDPTWGEIGRDYYGQPSLSHTAMFVGGTKAQLYSFAYYGYLPMETDKSIVTAPIAGEISADPKVEIHSIFPAKMTEHTSETLVVRLANTGNVWLHDVAVDIDGGGVALEESKESIKNISPYGDASIKVVASVLDPGPARIAVSVKAAELGGRTVEAVRIIPVTVTEKPLPLPRSGGGFALGGLTALVLTVGLRRVLWKKKSR